MFWFRRKFRRLNILSGRMTTDWKRYVFIGLDKVCRIESIECILELKEIYDRIKFSKKTLDFLKEIENI
jgi:hypothetical protein